MKQEEQSKITRESLMAAVRELQNYCIQEMCDSCLMSGLCNEIAPNRFILLGGNKNGE